MKRDEAKILSKSWSNYLVETMYTILNSEEEASITLPLAKIDRQWWCAFDIKLKNGKLTTPMSGATKIPEVHSEVFANQIVEDIIEKLLYVDAFDFSLFSQVKYFENKNFFGIHMKGENSKLTLNFEGCIPSKELWTKYNELLQEKERTKEGKRHI